MYEKITRVLPKKTREGYKDLLRYCNVKTDFETLIGFIISFPLGFSLFLALFFNVIFSLSLLLTVTGFFVVYFVTEVFVYMKFWMKAEKEGKQVEAILPDALELMTMNLKSGLTTERALVASARPEFGPLQRELKKAGKDIMTGKTAREALLNINKRVKSDMLNQTIKLITEGMNAGGELSDLLEQTADDIQNTQTVQKEIKANVMMYVIFIFFAVAIGAPLIFGISTYLVEVMQFQFGRYEIPEEATGEVGLDLAGADVQISAEFLLLYTILSLTITSIFGGLIVGLVKDGKEKAGVKYIPLLLILSLCVLFAVRMFVSGMFSGLM